MKIAKNTKVSILYTLYDEAGKQIDSSGESPLEYIHGNNQLIPGLEAMLEGKEPGVKFKAVVEPKEAYGEYNEKLVVDVPKEQFDPSLPIEVGMKFQATTSDGQLCLVHVAKISDDFITVDANHELAGKQLTFDIEIKDVKEATEEEIAQLSAGGCGGCGGCGGDCGGDGCNCGGDDCDCDGGCGDGNCKCGN